MIQDYVGTGKPLLRHLSWHAAYCLKKVKKTDFKWTLAFTRKSCSFSRKRANGETYKVPHMGWNRLEWVNPSPITKNLEEDYAYFVHSYYVNDQITQKYIIAKASYYEEVPAVVGRDKLFGMQFHPEKSSQTRCSSCYEILQSLV